MKHALHGHQLELTTLRTLSSADAIQRLRTGRLYVIRGHRIGGACRLHTLHGLRMPIAQPQLLDIPRQMRVHLQAVQIQDLRLPADRAVVRRHRAFP